MRPSKDLLSKLETFQYWNSIESSESDGSPDNELTISWPFGGWASFLSIFRWALPRLVSLKHLQKVYALSLYIFYLNVHVEYSKNFISDNVFFASCFVYFIRYTTLKFMFECHLRWNFTNRLLNSVRVVRYFIDASRTLVVHCLRWSVR